MSTTIYLARHGKTAANLENRFAGRTAEPLHRQGHEQIVAVAEKLKNRKPGAVYTGPLTRTRQSAQIIGQLIGAPVYEEEAFTEIYLPHWDGLTKVEITERFGHEYPTWLSSPGKFEVSGCESLALVQERAVAAVEAIFGSRMGETMVVVSHLIVIRCLVLYYSRQPLSEFRNIKIDNGSITGLSRDDGRGTEVRLDV